jgi:hypothetical protein
MRSRILDYNVQPLQFYNVAKEKVRPTQKNSYTCFLPLVFCHHGSLLRGNLCCIANTSMNQHRVLSPRKLVLEAAAAKQTIKLT